MERGVAGSGVVLRPNNSRAGVDEPGCSSGGKVLSSTVPESCARAEPMAARNKKTGKRAIAGIIHAPQCFGVRKLSAETRRHAPGGDTLPRVGRAVQT